MTHSLKGHFDFDAAQWQSIPRDDDTPSVLEIAHQDDGLVSIRSTAEPDRPPLVFTADEWDAFCDGASKGEFEIDRLRNHPGNVPNAA
jgi:hypothetical protein